MSPLQSASGMSPHRTVRLLEEVATADTLLGPEEGTGGGQQRGSVARGQDWRGTTERLGGQTGRGGCPVPRWAAVPDSRVRPSTEGLQGPEPMALKAWTCTRYSVHSSRSSMVNSRSTRSRIRWRAGCPRPSARAYRILYPTESGFPLYSCSRRGWQGQALSLLMSHNPPSSIPLHRPPHPTAPLTIQRSHRLVSLAVLRVTLAGAMSGGAWRVWILREGRLGGLVPTMFTCRMRKLREERGVTVWGKRVPVPGEDSEGGHSGGHKGSVPPGMAPWHRPGTHL